jgi:hypothetical protein
VLFEGKENTSSVNIKEITSAGIKLDITVAGKVSGKVTGQIISTHNILMKPGGTSEIEIKSLIFRTDYPFLSLVKQTENSSIPHQSGRLKATYFSNLISKVVVS